MSNYEKAQMIQNILYQRDERQYSQAWEATQKLIKDNYYGCYFFEGELYIRANLNDKARKSFEKALVSKNPIWIWRDLGIFFARGKYVRKDIKKARTCLEKINFLMRYIDQSNPEKVLKARGAFQVLKSYIDQSSSTFPIMENIEQNNQICPSTNPSSELLQQIWF